MLKSKKSAKKHIQLFYTYPRMFENECLKIAAMAKIYGLMRVL